MTNFFKYFTIILMSSYVSAECIDDVTGAYSVFGGCVGAAALGLNCDVPAYEAECPITCDACPTGFDGCNLPPMSISIVEGGAVLYNTNAGCSYCTDSTYITRGYCESWGDDGSGHASWIFYDSTMDDAECLEANGISVVNNPAKMGERMAELMG